MWPNETIICSASANSASRAHDRDLDRNQFIELALPPLSPIRCNYAAFSTVRIANDTTVAAAIQVFD